MRTVPAAANAAIRELDFKIVTDDKDDYKGTTYTCSQIVSINIQRDITEGGISIGNAISDRFSAVLNIDGGLPVRTRVKPHVRFDGGEWIQLGKFYVVECPKSRRGCFNVIAYDYLYLLDKPCTWKASSNGRVEKLKFPATYQEMLDYIITRYNLTCSFQCNEWTQLVKPEGYTYKQILGFMAASHGCNCKINDDGEVDFVPFSLVGDVGFSTSNIIGQQIDDASKGYTVNGLLITVSDENSIYIDDVPGSEYDEDASGILKIHNPLANIEIAEYCWNLLGGLNYIGTTITKRGTSSLQCGDVFLTYDYSAAAPESQYNAIVTSLEYDISADGGFKEIITSYADTSEVSASGNTAAVSSVSTSIDVDEETNTLTVHTFAGDEVYHLTNEGGRISYVEKDGTIVRTGAESKEMSNLAASRIISKGISGGKFTGITCDIYATAGVGVQLGNLVDASGTVFTNVDYGDGTTVESTDNPYHIYAETGYYRVHFDTNATTARVAILGGNEQTEVRECLFVVGAPIAAIESGYNAEYVSELVLHDSVESIGVLGYLGADYFMATGKSASIRLSKKLKSIGTMSYSAIDGMCIPASVSSIGAAAFAYTQLSHLTIEGGATPLECDKDAFSSLTYLASAGLYRLCIPGRLKVIPFEFCRYAAAAVIDVESGVEEISNNAFVSAAMFFNGSGQNVLHLNIPKSVAVIGQGIFSGNDVHDIYVHYAGTKSEFDGIDKAENWDSYNKHTTNFHMVYSDVYAGEGCDGDTGGVVDVSYTLPVATSNTLGGVKIKANGGIDIDNAEISIKTASSESKGGVKTGVECGITVDTETAVISLLPATDNSIGGVIIGKGLEVDENGVLTSSGGKAATTEELGTIIVGKGLEINEDGVLSVNGGAYTAGNGIDITEDEEKNVISVKVDNKKIKINEEGQLTTDPLVIENAVILSEDQASYMLHKYHEVSYVSGQRAVFSEVGSSIIAQGFSHYNGRCKTVIDGATLAETFPDGVPSGYNSFNLNLATSSGVTTTNYLIEAYHEYVNDSYGLYIRYSSDGGTTWTVSRQTAYGTFDRPDYFIHWKFTGIYAPTEAFPYGYTTASLYKVGHIKSYDGYRETAVNITNVTNSMKIPFASEAEYNAAIALTYEPNILTEVVETTTESN